MPNLYVLLFVGLLAAGLYGDYMWTKKQNKTLTVELAKARQEKAGLEAQAEAREIIDQAQAEAGRLLNDAQIESALNKERRVQKASADKIAATMARDAEKYTGFTERVMEKNFEIIACKSDYRRKEPCIGHVH